MRYRFVDLWVALFLALVLSVSGLMPTNVKAADLDQSQIADLVGNSYLSTNPDTGKRLLHLEGGPYQMGFQQGYWLASGVYRMTHEYIVYVLESFGLSESSYDALRPALIATCHANELAVPLEYRMEMLGVADGAQAQGYDVTYDDVMLINMAFDVLLSVAYPLATPLIALQEGGYGLPLDCDAFVAYGNATTDHGVLMGRDFMFTPHVFSEEALLVEYFPSSGSPFVSVTAPGFVGVTSAMNANGIAIGMDMVPEISTKPLAPGMGCLLTARKVIQYSQELSDAINTIKCIPRGVSWLYVIGDGGGNNIGGAVVEASPDLVRVRYTNYRYIGYFLPEKYFPRQIENKDDLVVVANHYIIPAMILANGSYAIEDSLWRYETLTGLLLDKYGSIDVESGKGLVDYLHPPAYGYYGDDPNQPIGASRTLYDLSNLKLWSLYGNYNDSWVYYDLGSRLSNQ